MRILSIQFQPNRAPRLKPISVLALMTRVAATHQSIRAFEFQKGNDRGPYINFFLTVPVAKLAGAWSAVRAQALWHRVLGAGLRRSCIVTCQGTRGWDNYLLLHHFNSRLTLDELASNNRMERTREK
jgi:hypothetical protein